MSERLSIEVARLGGRLADFLAAALPRGGSQVTQNLAFLRATALSIGRGEPGKSGSEPLDRLSAKLRLAQEEIEWLLLAGMPEEHEGYAAVFRTLHPRGEPRPTTGLAAQLFADGSRHVFADRFSSSNLTRSGAVKTLEDVPFFEKTIKPAESLWPALHGCEAWPPSWPRVEPGPVLKGLGQWLETVSVARARRALRQEQPCTILITADSEDTAYGRGAAVVESTGRRLLGISAAALVESDKWLAFMNYALACGAVPVLRIPPTEGAGFSQVPAFDEFPDCVVVCGRTGAVSVRGARPLIALLADRLSPEARRAMWGHTLTTLQDSAPLLAARYPIEPAAAAEVAADLQCWQTIEQRPSSLADVAEAIRSRGALSLGGGVKVIRPSASWPQLVLSRDREEQLRASIARLDLQVRVLDEWGFLRGRHGARGVRMLFAGPPGTGKTLSAEVLAAALGVDLLAVDISRVVSKWIGETEKNLAAVFDAAEHAQAVLLFDEADALFGRRTEVSDAHDRYANLETAYLLARLERFEGLAILSTNLRQNIDPAFLRRLEFVIDFDEPDRQERCRLWRCHIPDEKLLEADVNLDELATLYPVVGAFIRNAVVAAAFLAATNGGRISRHHLFRAIRREYEKAGKAFPGTPPDVKL